MSTISDLKARRIAAEWHGGQSSPLYAFTSTGAVLPGVEGEIRDCLIDAHWDTPRTGVRELRSLARYVAEHAGRGPVKGWADLSW